MNLHHIKIKWKTLIMGFMTTLAIRTSIIAKQTAIDSNHGQSVGNDKDIATVIK